MAVQGTRTRPKDVSPPAAQHGIRHLEGKHPTSFTPTSGSVGVRFVHCLPAFHDTDTVVGAEIVGETDTKEGLEVINDVFESPASIVFDLAENRPPTIKALLVVILGQ